MNPNLIPGGPTADLPPNWVAPAGWPMTGDRGAIWVGEQPAGDADIRRLLSRGWTPDEGSLCGLFHREWTAAQYAGQDASRLSNPWETLPRPGGEGSFAYQTQLIPEGVDRFATPGQWLFSEGGASRAKGGEPCHRVDLGGGHWEWHAGARPGTPAEGLSFHWDEEDRLWRLTN